MSDIHNKAVLATEPKKDLIKSTPSPKDKDDKSNIQYIVPDQLCIGLYVQLDLHWMKHPFLFKNFLIKEEKQILILKSLNLNKIAYNSAKSTCLPTSLQSAQPDNTEKTKAKDDDAVDEMWKEKQKRIASLKARREKMFQCEKLYSQSIMSVKNIVKELRSNSPNTVKAAEGVIGEMVTSFLSDSDVALHLVNVKEGGESEYCHIINVTVLALTLGAALGLKQSELNSLGLGALFHDIGKNNIPKKILRKTEPLTAAERELYNMHIEYGVKIASDLMSLPKEAINVIEQHHEAIDGSGFPNRLNGDDISRLAKIVNIVNTYDNYCNHVNPKKSKTPYEAVSYMFAVDKQKYDEEMISAFISSLGVYPPGTILELSNSYVGMVMSINHEVLLSPNVLIYNPKIPKEEAVILDLREEEELNVVRSIRPSQLSPEGIEYLNPGVHVNHYFDNGENS